MKTQVTCVVCLVVLGLGSGSEAWARDLRLVSNTYFRSYTRPGLDEPNDYQSFYEYVGLRSRDMGIEGLSVQASVWGMVDVGDIYVDEARATGDVNLLLLHYRAPERHALNGLDLKLGRQFVSVGPSLLEQLDGAYVTYRLPKGFTLGAFAGSVAGVRFLRQPWPTADGGLEYGGNWTAGGRLGYELHDRLWLGAGYRLKQYDGETAFNELNWDLVTTPTTWLELLSDGVAELTAQRLKAARAAFRLLLRANLDAGGGYRYVSPDLFIPRTSIFAVFSDETFQEGFVDVDWRSARWLSLRAEAAGMVYGKTCLSGSLGAEGQRCDDSDVHLRGLASANARFGFGGRHRATLELERRGAPDGGYWRARLATSLRALERLSVVVDVDGVLFDRPSEVTYYEPSRDRHRWGLSGSGYLVWRLRHDLDLLAGGQGWTSPIFDAAGAVTVRLNWILDTLAGSWGPVEVTRQAAGLSPGDPTLGGSS